MTPFNPYSQAFVSGTITDSFIAEALFRDFSKAASMANQDVQAFRKVMAEQEGLQVLEQARKSRAERPKGIKSWKVCDHPDWLTRDN